MTHATARREKVRPAGDFRNQSNGELTLTSPFAPPPLDAHAARAKALAGSPEQRAAFLESEVFILTPDFCHVIDVIERMVGRRTAFVNAGGMRIVASSGMGKDTIIRYLERKYRPSWSGGRLLSPLLSVHFTQRPSPGDILKHFLDQLGAAHRNARSIKELQDDLVAAMDACGTLGLIFNEAQHLLYSSSASARVRGRLAGETGDWLKRFLDTARRPAFFFGIPGWDQLFELDAQLGSRIPHRHEILEFGFDSKFIGILKALDLAIPMPEPAGLDEPALAAVLHEVTKGKWRLLIHVLKEAIISASTAGATRIERQDLSAAYQMTFGLMINPFGRARTT